MAKTAIHTTQAPAAIGPYSQAVRAGDSVYLSGQIGLDPSSGQLLEGLDAQVERVFSNLEAVTLAAGGMLDDIVRLTIYLTDLANFGKVNDAMAKRFEQPYPARATLGVASLPRGALVEVDAIMHLPISR
jgi:reactive intermediate/imine deaminase